MNVRPIAAELFKTTPNYRLIGARHKTTGRHIFPGPGEPGVYEAVELPARGRLWSYTVQRFAPKSPPYRAEGPFAPFALGYVELPGALIVESRLIDTPFDRLRVGLPMELTTFVLRSEGGQDVLMFAFRAQTDVAS